MQLKSIETTPNPNSMKLNLSEKQGSSATYTLENANGCADFVEDLLKIDGVKSVFVCNDFVTLNRDPRSDWRSILEKATAVFGEVGSSNAANAIEMQRAAFEKEGSVQVLIQTFKGVPIQVKVLDSEGETRISLGDRFNETAQEIQNESGADFLKERYWADHGVRYGTREDIANEVANELRGTIDEEALKRIKQNAASSEPHVVPLNVVMQWLEDIDWHKRLSAVQELRATEETVPLLAKALQDESPQVRRLAAAALGTTGSIDAIPALCDAVLNDQSIGVRRTAGDALSDIGDPLAEPAMCHALSDGNKLVRWRAARFLFDVGTDEAIPFLENAKNDSEFEVRLEVEAAIERIKCGLQGLGPAWKRIVQETQ